MPGLGVSSDLAASSPGRLQGSPELCHGLAMLRSLRVSQVPVYNKAPLRRARRIDATVTFYLLCPTCTQTRTLTCTHAHRWSEETLWMLEVEVFIKGVI